MAFPLPSTLSCNFGTLDGGLGCFPLHHGLSTRSVSAIKLLTGIRSLIRFGKMMSPPSLFSALPPVIFNITLYLNRFRGEPAISKFDWPFTPNHNSSNTIATVTGSILQCILLHLQSGHG